MWTRERANKQAHSPAPQITGGEVQDGLKSRADLPHNSQENHIEAALEREIPQGSLCLKLRLTPLVYPFPTPTGLLKYLLVALFQAWS